MNHHREICSPHLTNPLMPSGKPVTSSGLSQSSARVPFAHVEPGWKFKLLCMFLVDEDTNPIQTWGDKHANSTQKDLHYLRTEPTAFSS